MQISSSLFISQATFCTIVVFSVNDQNFELENIADEGVRRLEFQRNIEMNEYFAFMQHLA